LKEGNFEMNKDGIGKIKRFEAVSDYNDFNNTETLHPLVSVIDMSKAVQKYRCCADLIPY
jgi:hypothetical protein